METDVTNLDPKILKVMKALRSIESGDGKGGGGNYKAVGDAGSSTGAFQWNNGKTPVKPGQIPINFQSDARTYGFDPTDFSPANQNKVMYHKIKAQRDAGLGPEEIAALHNGASKDKVTGKYIYNNPDYGVKFRTALGGAKVNIPNKITPENFDYGSIEQAQAEGRKSRGMELVKDFGNALTEAPMVLGGGVLNAATQAVGGTPQATYMNPLGTQQDALGYRDGQELGAWDTAKQGAGALAEGLSYGIGGGAIPELAQAGKAGISAYVKPAVKAGVQSGFLQGTGSSLQKGDDVPVALAKGAGTSILGGVLGGGLGLGGAAYNKVAGYSPKIFNALDDAVRSGDDAAIEKVVTSPEYQQVVKANKVDDKTASKFVDKTRQAIEEGIDKSYGTAKLTRAEKAETLTDDGIIAMAEHAQFTNNPIADTKIALQNKANDLMDEALTPILNKVRDDKLPLADLDRKSLLGDFNSRLDKTFMTDLEKKRVKDYVNELLTEQNKGNPFGIVDAGIIRRNANFDFVNDKNKGAVSRLLGNTMRDALDLAEKNAIDPKSKAIIAHINAVNKEYSRLMQGIDVVDLMARFPGQKSSELLNKAAGFMGAGATGNNPLAYLSAHRVTNNLQNILIRSKNKQLFGDIAGKTGPINSSQLIGNAKRILNDVQYVSNKEVAVNKLMETISPKRDKDLPSIAYGAAPFGVVSIIDKIKNMGKETYQREPEPEKDNIEDIANKIANAETRGEKEPYSTWKWSNRKLGKASPLGKDLGKYQITSARLREKSEDFLGRKVTDSEFLKSPELQDKFIKAQIKWQKSHGMSEEEILATHRRGWGNLKPEQIKKAVATSSEYIESARSGK